MLALLSRIVAVTIGLILLAEIGVRSAIVAPASIEPHPQLGWLYTPGARVLHTSEGYATHTMNSLGLNDRELSSDSPPALVVLGDSFVESLQLDTALNFTSLLETSTGCTNVLNAGRSGISPLHFPAMYQHVAAGTAINGVIAAVGPGDFHDLKNARLSLQTDAQGNVTDLGFTAAELNPLRKKLDGVLRRSALATYLLNRLKAARAPKTRPATTKHDVSHDSTNERQQALAHSVLTHVFGQIPPKRSVVLYLPELTYLDNRTARATDQSAQFLSIVRRAAAARNLPIVDTTEALINLYQSVGQPGHGFANNSAVSGHLNAAGHQVIARQLTAELSQLSLCQ